MLFNLYSKSSTFFNNSDPDLILLLSVNSMSSEEERLCLSSELEVGEVDEVLGNFDLVADSFARCSDFDRFT